MDGKEDAGKCENEEDVSAALEEMDGFAEATLRFTDPLGYIEVCAKLELLETE